jgi:hypothetical protein
MPDRKYAFLLNTRGTVKLAIKGAIINFTEPVSQTDLII